MNLSFIPVNDWSESAFGAGAVDLLALGYDYGETYFYIRFRLLGFGFSAGWFTDYTVPADEFAPADIRPDPYTAMQDAWVQAQAAHPFQDPDALTGNITTPAGAQGFTVVPQEGGGGWGVVDVTRAAYVPNPVNQHTGD